MALSNSHVLAEVVDIVIKVLFQHETVLLAKVPQRLFSSGRHLFLS